MPSDTKDDGQNRRPLAEDPTERIVVLLRRFFHTHFCPAEEIPPGKKCAVEPFYFCGWLDKHMGEFDQVTECEAAGVPLKTWDHVRNILDKGTAPEQLFHAWYAIVLSDRPPPKNPVKDVNVIFNVTYQDGTISTTQVYAAGQPIVEAGGVVDDAMVFSTLRQSIRNVMDTMIGFGLDALHDRAQVDASFTHPETDPYDLIMGFIQKFLIRGEPFPHAPNGAPAGFKADPRMHKALVTWYRLIQQMLRPVLAMPPAAAAALKRTQVQQAAEAKGKVVGGWDAP